MTALYHTNGSTGLYVGNGTGGSFLGFSSADGVTVNRITGMNPINSDERGPSVPSEVLINGTMGRCELELWKYDARVVGQLMALREGGTLGLLNTVGTLMFYNGLTFGLTLSSPNDGDPVFWPRCWISEDPVSVQLSTQLKIWRLQITMCPNASGVLYQTAGS